MSNGHIHASAACQLSNINELAVELIGTRAVFPAAVFFKRNKGCQMCGQGENNFPYSPTISGVNVGNLKKKETSLLLQDTSNRRRNF